MNTFSKAVVLSCAIFAGGLFAASESYAAEPIYGVKVQVNDSLMNTSDAEAYIDGSEKLQVPFRITAESLGYTIQWEADDSGAKRVIMKKDDQSVIMKTGDNYALVNDSKVTFDYRIDLTQKVAYIPVRFFSQIGGVDIKWNENSGLAMISTDGGEHKPLWTEADKRKLAQKAEVSKQRQLLQLASNYLGTRYVWGGTSPNGFDCSGFVQFVYQKHGIDLPRTSRQMYAELSQSVSELKQGDLVFFAAGSTISHVGIFVGNNQFISATDDGVAIKSLSGGYWGPKYIGAKRVL